MDEQQLQQLVSQVAQALSQGANPQEIMQGLVQQGVPQEAAQQIIQTAMEAAQGGQMNGNMNQENQSVIEQFLQQVGPEAVLAFIEEWESMDQSTKGSFIQEVQSMVSGNQTGAEQGQQTNASSDQAMNNFIGQ